MDKSELRNGMSLIRRDKCKFYIIENLIMEKSLTRKDKYNLIYDRGIEDFLIDYTDDLKIEDYPEFDIMKVYDADDKLIWERDEIDWSKVPKDTKVLVKNITDKLWYPRYFVEYKNGKYNTYINGSTSWSTDDFPEEWDYCKLAEEQKEEITLEELIQKHDKLHKSCHRNCMACKYDVYGINCQFVWMLNNYKVIKK